MQEFLISKEDEGQTVLKYLNRYLKEAPNGLLYKQFRNKNITLNKKKISGNEKLKSGDILYVFMSDETISKFKGIATKSTSEYTKAFDIFKSPDIVYEDSHIIIFNKPVGVLSQKSTNNDLSANEWLIGYMLSNNETNAEKLSLFTPSVCNRLDRNTGGLLLFGKTLFGTNILNGLLKNRTLHKYYKTIVKGNVSESVYIKGYLYKDDKTNKVLVSKVFIEGYDEIETAYKPLRYNKVNDYTELEVLLITGKPHQIRAHLAYSHHPIIGDYKYGDKALNQRIKNDFGLDNQLLYAYKVIFPDITDYQDISGKTFEKSFNNIFDKFF